jgi:hypothetical protein
MSGSLRIDPALVKQASDELKTAVTEVQGPLAADAQLEAARAAHGPIMAELKDALAEVLPARRQELLDQIAFGTEKAEEIAMWAVNFEVGEEEHRRRQSNVGH